LSDRSPFLSSRSNKLGGGSVQEMDVKSEVSDLRSGDDGDRLNLATVCITPN